MPRRRSAAHRPSGIAGMWTTGAAAWATWGWDCHLVLAGLPWQRRSRDERRAVAVIGNRGDRRPGSDHPLRTMARYFAGTTNWSVAFGSTEVWKVLDLTADTHPFHVHLVQFQVLSRDRYDTDGFDSAVGGTTAPVTFLGQGELDQRALNPGSGTARHVPRHLRRCFIYRLSLRNGALASSCTPRSHVPDGVRRRTEHAGGTLLGRFDGSLGARLCS
jgi:hypothetical protein